MSRIVKKGAADQTIYVEVLDSTSTTGGRKTGLAYNTSGLVAYYARNRGAATAITLADLAAADSSHSDGGFKEVSSANMPGVYRLDLPDAAVATGADSVVVTLKGATGMAQVSAEIQLADNTEKDVYDRLGSPAGASVSADIAGVQSDTNDIQSRLPAALVSGRIDASVGAMASGVLTATAIAGDAITAAKVAADVGTELADAILDRDMATGTDSGSSTVRTVRQALRFLRNKWSISGTTLTVTKEDDSTASWTSTVTATAGADPITANDPAGP
jgi:hypothetical protein